MGAVPKVQVTTEATGFADPISACEWAIRQLRFTGSPGDTTLLNITQRLGADLEIYWTVRICTGPGWQPKSTTPIPDWVRTLGETEKERATRIAEEERARNLAAVEEERKRLAKIAERERINRPQ